MSSFPMIRPESTERDMNYDLPDGWTKRVVHRNGASDLCDVYLTPPNGYKLKSGRKRIRSSTELRNFILENPDCPIDPHFVNMNRSPEPAMAGGAVSPTTRKLVEFIERRNAGLEPYEKKKSSKEASEPQQPPTRKIAKACVSNKAQKPAKSGVEATSSKKEPVKIKIKAKMAVKTPDEKPEGDENPETQADATKSPAPAKSAPETSKGASKKATKAGEPTKKATKAGEPAKKATKATKIPEPALKMAGVKRSWRLSPKQKQKILGKKLKKMDESEPEPEPYEPEEVPEFFEVTYITLITCITFHNFFLSLCVFLSCRFTSHIYKRQAYTKLRTTSWLYFRNCLVIFPLYRSCTFHSTSIMHITNP